LCPSPACIACLFACASPELRSLKTDMPAFVEGAAAASERCESCRTTGCTAPEDPSGRSGRSSLLLRGDMVIRHDSAPNANERSVGLWKCARREQDANDVAGTRARLHDERVGFKGCAQDRTEPSSNYRRPSLDEKEEVDSERIATRSDGKSGRLKLQLFHPGS
jgi:hypothetical protein